MTVTVAHFWTVKPGRGEDAMAFFRQGKEAVESIGGQNARLRRVTSGELTNLYFALHDVESLPAYGAQLDPGTRSEEVRALLANAWQADSPVNYQGNWVMSELGLHGEPNPDSSAFLVRNWDVKPGRIEAVIDLVGATGALLDRHGGFGQAWRITIGGNMTGVYTTAAGFPSQEALYSYLEDLQSSPEGQAIAAQLGGADAPAVTRSLTTAVSVPF